jgi:peptidoglycan/xylan/chitin deacetylase (PgdA/CDA1 family)
VRRLLVATAVVLIAAPAAAEPVALTFDDLPVFGPLRPVAEQAAITRKLLRGLVRHHLPAIGFVNEINLEGADRPARVALLRAWLDAGMDLGNHTYSHVSLTRTPVADYIADTANGEVVTKALLTERGRTMRWFRYPYLETGPTADTRQTFDDWLAKAGYHVAPVTLENSDYLFADPYDAALKAGQRRRAKDIRLEYIRFSAVAVPWYRSAGLALFGRRPALVWLLHASKLNADSIGALAKIIHRQGLTPVRLDTAMADPAYRTPEDYVGPNGIEWLERWSLTLHRDLPWNTMPKPPKDIEVESAALDDEPVVHGTP